MGVGEGGGQINGFQPKKKQELFNKQNLTH